MVVASIGLGQTHIHRLSGAFGANSQEILDRCSLVQFPTLDDVADMQVEVLFGRREQSDHLLLAEPPAVALDAQL